MGTDILCLKKRKRSEVVGNWFQLSIMEHVLVVLIVNVLDKKCLEVPAG